jgi:putative Ca2+/H+ antiporter (TMEM165/GDT1 family)
MEPFLISTGIVALAEMGDKTQLLALVLAARFRKPFPIVLGILVATVLNHALAGLLGTWLVEAVGPNALRIGLGVSFLIMAGWTLIPDKLDADEAKPKFAHLGVFGTTTIAFFLAEMADKTQVATIALAARFDAYAWVVAGTTLGMLIANAPVVWLGERFAHRIPLKLVHGIAALIFAVLGVVTLIGF